MELAVENPDVRKGGKGKGRKGRGRRGSGERPHEEEGAAPHDQEPSDTDEALGGRARQAPPPVFGLDFVESVLSKCVDVVRAKDGPRMSFAGVDAQGHLVALKRMDGAMLLSPSIAHSKAYTAAILRRPTADVAADAETRPNFYSAINRMGPVPLIPGPGGIPIVSGAAVIGAVGASGGTPLEDVAVLVEALVALGLQKGNIVPGGPACFKLAKAGKGKGKGGGRKGRGKRTDDAGTSEPAAAAGTGADDGHNHGAGESEAAE